MLKHTPGPWHVQKSDHPGGLLIKPIPGQVVAQCDEIRNMRQNAALIAAAPELLEAAKLAAEFIRGLQKPGICMHDYGQAGKLEAAIAKAEGRI